MASQAGNRRGRGAGGISGGSVPGQDARRTAADPRSGETPRGLALTLDPRAPCRPAAAAHIGGRPTYRGRQRPLASPSSNLSHPSIHPSIDPWMHACLHPCLRWCDAARGGVLEHAGAGPCPASGCTAAPGRRRVGEGAGWGAGRGSRRAGHAREGRGALERLGCMHPCAAAEGM
eukprot:scaffold3761_cov372-Prasinococcus_capsulatus_cf.AAC.14